MIKREKSWFERWCGRTTKVSAFVENELWLLNQKYQTLNHQTYNLSQRLQKLEENEGKSNAKS